MTRPTDEQLMAYADGQLDEPERRRIEEFLATDAEARQLVEGFRKTADLSGLFDAPMRAAPPKRLVDAIMKDGNPARKEPQAGAKIVSLPSRRPDRAPPRQDRRLAMAASVALLIGAATGYWLAGGTTREEPGTELALGRVTPGSAIARVLDTAPSGKPQRIGGGGGKGNQLLVVATFRDRNGRACREVELLDGTADLHPISAGIACHAEGHGWVVEGAARIRVAKPASGTNYVPSGVAERDALEGLMQILGASKAMTAEEEQALIRRGWK